MEDHNKEFYVKIECEYCHKKFPSNKIELKIKNNEYLWFKN